MNTSTTLWYDHPAAKWTDALPLGNGSLGAMVYGGCPQEKLCLNLDTLWSGRPYPKETGDLTAIYRRAQALTMEGRPLEAQALINEQLLTQNGHTYLPLGNLCMELAEEGAVSGYVRSLDLKTGLHTVEFDRAKTRWSPAVRLKETCFVSYPDQCLVLRLEADAPVTVQFTLTSLLRHTCLAEEGALVMDVQCPAQLTLLRDGFTDEEGGVQARVACAAQSDGRVKCQGSAIRVEAAREITLLLCAENSFAGYDRDPVTQGKEYRQATLNCLRAAQRKGYFDLLEVHACDIARYFDRVTLDLGEREAGRAPTDRRLIAHEAGEEDPSLYTLLFNYARYLMIVGSRPGTQPMNLQGIWNDQLFAPWASNYTVNINTEMNYWPALSANLAEMTEPLTKMLEELSVVGRDAAKKYYGAQGWTAHHNIDLWRQCFPAYGCAHWGFWYNGGAWLSRNLYDQYLYTRDEEFLRERAYPILRGCAEFYLSLLTEDEEGRLILCPSTSPENHYWLDGKPCDISRTTTMTMSIAREAMEHTLECARILGTDEALCRQIEETLPRLLPLRVGSDGRLMEWYDEREDTEVHHRHVSHLYALHPAHQITPEDTPELIDACKRTLTVRGDDGTGWSLGWKINFWARLRDGDHALRLLDNQLRFVAGDVDREGGGTYANLFDAHPPFQIDGNFGACSGIIEMLLQADGKRIHLLPALPSAWQKGSVQGLKAPGEITVCIAWENGQLTWARLESPITQRVQLTWPGGGEEICLTGGQAWTRGQAG